MRKARPITAKAAAKAPRKGLRTAAREPAAREPAARGAAAAHEPGRRLTLNDIAAHAGVSRATVSLVLRKSPLVKSETRARVDAAMSELGYVYNRRAANLRSGASRTIGLVLCEITTPNYAQLTAGIEEVLDADGYVAFITNTAEDSGRQARMLVRMQEHGVDGIVMVPAEATTQDALSAAHCAGLPCVLAQRRVDGLPADYVGPDYAAGMDLVTEHLIGLGHRRIGFVGGVRQIAPLDERIAGFRRALARHALTEAGITPCAVLDRISGYEAGRALFGGRNPPTALVCYNDIVAFGIMLAAIEHGLVPGRDVAVTGCDDVAEAALHRPGLTTFTTDPRRVGRESARLLLARVADPARAAQEVVVPPRLVVRQSCGAPPAAAVSARPARSAQSEGGRAR